MWLICVDPVRAHARAREKFSFSDFPDITVNFIPVFCLFFKSMKTKQEELACLSFHRSSSKEYIFRFLSQTNLGKIFACRDLTEKWVEGDSLCWFWTLPQPCHLGCCDLLTLNAVLWQRQLWGGCPWILCLMLDTMGIGPSCFVQGFLPSSLLCLCYCLCSK